MIAATMAATGCSQGEARDRVEAVLAGRAQALTSTPGIETFAATAEVSLYVENNGRIEGGHAGVITQNGTPLYVNNFELAVDQNGYIDPAKLTIADSVKVLNNGTVGDIGAGNTSFGNNANHGAVSAFATPPPLPSLLPVTSGSTAVTVNANQTSTLAPGAYGAVLVKNNATLRLSGGSYSFASLTVEENARVELLAAGDVRVGGRVSVQQNGFVGPTWSGATASDLPLHVHGTDSGSNWAFSCVQNGLVRALVLAPNGTVDVYQNGTIVGAAAAKFVHVRQNGKITWQSGFGSVCPTGCDDGNPCTTDVCVSGACSHTALAAGTSCADGNACNGAETCDASATCVAGTPPTVDDGNPCTTDTCNPTMGVVHTPVATGTSCSDGNACNGAETCSAAGNCVSGTPPVVDDGNPCTVDACTAGGGVTHMPVAEGTSCSLCGGTCNAGGTCVAGSVNVDDGNPCTADGCNPLTGVFHTPVAAGTSCADGNACNGAETCNGAGTCLAGTAPPVDDGNPCTADACSPTGGVTHTPLAAGTSCSDGNACNGAETCNGGGACVAGTPPVADDGNPCTVDGCVPATGVVHTPTAAGTSCADGNVCNGAETCDGAGACVAGVALNTNDGNPCTADACDPILGVTHAPVAAGTTCADGNACNGTETCNAGGTCTAGTAPTVDDNNPCTADACDPELGVTHTPVAEGTSCSACGATCSATGTCVAGTINVDDGNPCTADGCDPQTGVFHTPVAAGTSCSDGNACNGAETCAAGGTCQAGTPPVLDDANPCTVDVCDAVAGVQHVPAVVGTSCADGNACNGAETCNGVGACVAGTPPTVDDGNPCTADACDALAGVTHTPVAAGTSCADGNVCNGAEACDAAGACQPGSAPVVDDGNPCTADACDPHVGVTHTPVAAGTSCSDGNACNGAETCNAGGSCIAGTAPVVDDGNACTTDACDPGTGVSHTPVAVGTSCSDGNACNGAETCSATGSCLAGTAPVVDDGNPCTVDACDATAGVTHVNAVAGTACADGNACNGAETCDGSGTCSPGTPPSVDDGNPCTTDACNPATGVSHTPVAVGTSCSLCGATCNAGGTCVAGSINVDDGNPCTADACDPSTGVSHTPVAAGTSCSDGNACNGAETCNGAGTCLAGTAPAVDDGNPCTADACNPATGVSHTPLASGTSCSDGNACNGAEACNGAGACLAGTPPTVDDGNPCTTDACDPGSGVTHTAVAAGTSCADGNACNGAETCNGSGTCVAGTPPVIDDGNPCTTDACNAATGVSHTALAAGSSCSDGNACNGAETCNASAACVAGTPPVVDDGNPCTTDACDPGTGVTHTAVAAGVSCSDGNACNGAESCNGSGACVAGTPPTVDDGNPCTTDACNPATGVSHTPVAAGTSCSDGNACNGVEVCDAGGACASGTAVVCAPGDACHEDGVCNPATGVCTNALKAACEGGLPPDPCAFDDVHDPGVSTTLLVDVKNVYSGAYPSQTGFSPGVFADDNKIAPLRGRILDEAGEPLSGVTISVAQHAEYGSSKSRLDGKYDLVVNGGPMYSLRFEKAGYLPVQRKALTPWGEFVDLEDVVMIPRDPNATTLAFGTGTSCQAALAGSTSTDADGTRRSLLVVNPGTEASVVASGGGTTPTASAAVRMTEYSIGADGQKRLPGTLPVESAYFYALEIGADEGTLSLSQPVVHYVENFVGLPVGKVVPAASLEHCDTCGGERREWKATDNGRVVKILTNNGSTVTLDTNGDGVAETAGELAILGVSACELTQLSGYPAGTVLVRNVLPRLGTWSLSPGFAHVPYERITNKKWPDPELTKACTDDRGGVSIDLLNRRVTTRDAIAGTPFDLVCTTGRADLLESKQKLTVWDADQTGTLKRIDVYTTQGGKTVKTSYLPAPLVQHEISWDGKDACGKPLYGTQPVTVKIAYVYGAEYAEVPRFGLTDATPTGTVARGERYEWRTETVEMDRAHQGAARTCDLDVHHVFDKRGSLFRGDGKVLAGKAIGPVIETVVGGTGTPIDSSADPGCNMAAKDFPTGRFIRSLAVAPNGDLFFGIDIGAGVARIYRLGAEDGIVHCAAGNGVPGYSGDGGPATLARINSYYGNIVPSRECAGCFYLADHFNKRIRYVDAAGKISTVVGDGSDPVSIGIGAFQPPAGTPGTSVPVQPWGMTLGHDDSLYFATTGLVGRLLPDGTVHHVVGVSLGTGGTVTPDNTRAVTTPTEIFSLAVGPTGRLFLGDRAGAGSLLGGGFNFKAGLLRDLQVDGVAHRVSGLGPKLMLDGISAEDGAIPNVDSVGVFRDGTPAFAHLHTELAGYTDGWGAVLGRFDANDIGRVVSGATNSGNGLDLRTGQPAYGTIVNSLFANPVAIAPDGTIYAATIGKIDRLTRALVKANGPVRLPSEDAREVYEFDASGRHLRTRDAMTGAVRFEFAYDASGRLSGVTDLAGNATTLQRDGSGRLSAIVSATGLVTAIGTDADGFVTSVQNPAGGVTTTVQGTPKGLIASRTDASGAKSSFLYDTTGRLVDFRDAEQGGLTFSGASEQGVRTVSVVTPNGVTNSYYVTFDGSDAETRTHTSPDLSVDTQIRTPGATLTTVFASGYRTELALAPDPRFAMASPFAKTMVLTDASGKKHTQLTTRAVTLSDPSDPFSLVSVLENRQVGPATQALTYTAASRTFSRDGGQETMKIDAYGRLVELREHAFSALPVVHTFAYDAAGRVSSATRGDFIRTYGYDASGYVQSETSGFYTTTFTRDAMGRVTSETLPDGSVVTYARDGEGRVTGVTRPAHSADGYAYSATGRLLSTPVHAYTYDTDGRLRTVVGGAVTSTISYDASNRLAAATGLLDADYVDPKTTVATRGAEVVRLESNGLFTTKAVWSGDVAGTVVLGRATGTKVTREDVGTVSIGYGFGPDGMMTVAGEMTLGNIDRRLTFTNLKGLTDVRLFDQNGFRTYYEVSGFFPRPLQSAESRDARGRLTSRTETRNDIDHTTSYSYDPRGRLSLVNRDGVPSFVAYDTVGNRLSVTTNGVPVYETYDASDRILTHGTTTYVHDAAGRLASKTTPAGTTTYTYDVLGELVHVSLPDGRQIDYVLDALGRRVGKKVDGVLVKGWLYRDAVRPLAELDGTGAVTARYVYGDGDAVTPTPAESLKERAGLAKAWAPKETAPMYLVKGDQRIRVVTDELGTPRLFVDAVSHLTLHEAERDPWGNALSESGTLPASIGFHGGLYDADTGLTRIGHREYDPETGRFTTPDPRARFARSNLYAVNAGDPLNDPACAVGPFVLPGEEETREALDGVRLDSLCGMTPSGELRCGDAPKGKGGFTTDLPSLPLNARDGVDSDLLAAQNPVDLYGGSAAPNTAPVVTASALAVSTPATGVQILGASASDDGQPQPLVTTWSIVGKSPDGDPSGDPVALPPGWPPAVPPLFIHNPSSVTTLMDFYEPGRYLMRLSAFDGEFTSSATVEVTVTTPPVGSDPAPSVTVSGPTAAAVLSSISLTATATVNGAPMVGGFYAWEAISGPNLGTPAAPQITNGTTATPSISFPAAGQYVFRVTVTHNGSTRYVTHPVSATVQNQPPTINAGADVVLGTWNGTPPSFSLLTTASDDGFPTGHGLFYSWSQVSGPGGVTFATPALKDSVVTFPMPGAYVLRVTAFDGELSASDDVMVTIPGPAPTVGNPTDPPTVALTAPSDDALVTKPTAVTGDVSDGAWTLTYRAGGRDDSEDPWIVLATGNGPKTGQIATFDPTLLENGVYTLRLATTTSVGSAEDTRSVSVDGNMKIGLFSLSFNDVEVNMGNLSMTVVRTYDSRTKDVLGDFGYGWKLSTRDVKLTKSGKVGKYWQHQFIYDPIVPTYCLRPAKAATVAVTLPNGRQYRFRPQAVPECQSFLPITTPEISWVSDTDPGNPTIAIAAEGGTDSLIAPLPAPGPTLLQTASGDPWDPNLFVMTTEDGTKLTIVNGKLKKVENRNGESYELHPDGIRHSAGRDILFERDNLGRIAKITDPDEHSLVYSYDAAGDLNVVTDRVGNQTKHIYKTKVGTGASTHYLEKYIDGRGIQVQRNEYDEDGRLVAVVDAVGKTTALGHDLGNNRESITDRLGHVTIHEYDDRGNVTKTIDALGGVKTSTYDARDNMLSETDQIGRTTHYTYDGAFNRTSVTNPAGETRTMTYNGFGQVLAATDPLGHTTTYVYDSLGNETQVTNALGQSSLREYDERGRLRGTTDANGAKQLLEYDGFNRLERSVSPTGRVVYYRYDSSGRETLTFQSPSPSAFGINQAPHPRWVAAPSGDGLHVTFSSFGSTDDGLPVNGTRTYTWEVLDGPGVATFVPNGTDGAGSSLATFSVPGTFTVRLTISDGQLAGSVQGILSTTETTLRQSNPEELPTPKAGDLVTTKTLDPDGLTKSVHVAGGVSRSWTRDGAGRPVEERDALGRVSKTEYDLMGGVRVRVRPDGTRVTYGYDDEHRLTSATDECGRTTAWDLDPLGRPIGMTHPDGAHPAVSRDAAGQVIEAHDALGGTVAFVYDLAGREIARTDPEGRATATQYDAAGRPLARTQALGRTLSWVHDAIGQQVSATDGAGASWTYQYDPTGRRTAAVDPLGRTAEWAYDADGRVTESRDEGGNAWSFAHDSLGRLVATTDARGSTTTRTYDANNNCVKEVDATGAVESRLYDAEGQLVESTDADGVTTRFQRDLRGRVLKEYSFAAGSRLGSTVVYTYDACGRKSRTDSDTGYTSWTYDGRGRVASRSTPVGTMFYERDGEGRVLRARSSTPGGFDSRYEWDRSGRLTSVNDNLYKTSYVYNQAGEVESYTTSGALKTTFARDVAGRVTGKTDLFGAGSVESYGATRDPIGRLTAIDSGSGEHAAWTYTVGGRLAAETNTRGGVSSSRVYAYDQVGNRVSRSIVSGGASSTQQLQYDPADRLVGAGVTPAGFQTLRDGVGVAWDGQGRVRSVANSGMSYDGDGHLMGVTGGVEQTRFLVDTESPAGRAVVVEEHRADGVRVHTFGLEVLRTRGGTDCHYVSDIVGDVRLCVDNLGALVGEQSFDAFGNVSSSAGGELAFGYRGERRVVDGLVDLRARIYDPRTGRFLSKDSFSGDLASPHSLHRYLYAHGEPVQFRDPTGHFAVPELLQPIILAPALGEVVAQGLSGFGSKPPGKVQNASVPLPVRQFVWDFYYHTTIVWLDYVEVHDRENLGGPTTLGHTPPYKIDRARNGGVVQLDFKRIQDLNPYPEGWATGWAHPKVIGTYAHELSHVNSLLNDPTQAERLEKPGGEAELQQEEDRAYAIGDAIEIISYDVLKKNDGKLYK